MFDLITVLGLAAALIFAIGIVKGALGAFHSRQADARDDDALDEDDGGYAWPAALAVIVSASVIALAGVAPAFIYLGPLLATGTAAGVGVAFLVGDRN
jgi:glucose uptake protein GlcU